MKQLSKNEQLLLTGISSFDKTANEVMQLMAKQFNLNLKESNPFSIFLIRKNDLWKGSFKNWNYRFHGDSCEFIDTKTNQFLDIKINRNNFGTIDLYFLWKYFSTTPDLNEQAVLFKDPETKHLTFEKLKEKKHIINTGDKTFPAFVLNKQA